MVFWGACVTWWKQFQESDMWSPQRQFGEESSKIGRWIGTVMFRRKRDNGENAHNFSYTEENKDYWKGRSCVILDFLIVDPPSFKFCLVLFLLCLKLFVCNKIT